MCIDQLLNKWVKHPVNPAVQPPDLLNNQRLLSLWKLNRLVKQLFYPLYTQINPKVSVTGETHWGLKPLQIPNNSKELYMGYHLLIKTLKVCSLPTVRCCDRHRVEWDEDWGLQIEECVCAGGPTLQNHKQTGWRYTVAYDVMQYVQHAQYIHVSWEYIIYVTCTWFVHINRKLWQRRLTMLSYYDGLLTVSSEGQKRKKCALFFVIAHFFDLSNHKCAQFVIVSFKRPCYHNSHFQ